MAAQSKNSTLAVYHGIVRFFFARSRSPRGSTAPSDKTALRSRDAPEDNPRRECAFALSARARAAVGFRHANQGGLSGAARHAKGRITIAAGALMGDFGELNLVGNSPAFVHVLELTRRCAGCEATVLVQGET